jgi:hypothetical protein
MSKKLTTITPSYHSFVPDQVLTHGQLNELIDFFEDQDRLSRICLSGVGLVCGFNVLQNATNKSITITNGAGVTTDGDLLHLLLPNAEGVYQFNLPSVTYTRFGEFFDDNALYTPQFWKPDNTQVKLWEIFPNTATDKSLLSNFTTETTLNFSEMVVLLYLEDYTNDPGACTTVSCDNQGAEEVRQLRVLLTHQDNMPYINTSDTLFNNGDVVTTYLNSVDADVARVTLNANNSQQLGDLAASYFSAIGNAATVANIKAGLSLMLTKMGLTTLNNDLQTAITNAFKTQVLNGLYFQYRYDLLKDVTDTYNELREEFLEKYGICCPNIEAFPKHLLLGKLYTAESDKPEQMPFRHEFYKSPILDPEYDERGRFQFLATRMLELVQHYASAEFLSQVILTPSNLYTPLGNRAIPFYYTLDTAFLKNWDYDRRNYGKYERILGYRRSLINTSPQRVKTPFSFSIDANNFYRIEGIQGLKYQDALEDVLEIRDNFSLPFDVKVLGIDISDITEINVDDYACEFEDLAVLMTAWTDEQQCILAEVTYLLSGFSTKVQGDNIRKDKIVQFKEYRKLSDSKQNITLDSNTNLRFTESKTFLKGETTFFQQTNSGTKSKADSLVLENMAVEEDSLGLIVANAIDIAPTSDSSLLIAYIQQALEAIDFIEWTPVVVDSTVKLPAKILAACYAIEALLPDSIEGLSDNTLETYTTEIDKLCTYTKQLTAKYKEYVYGEYTAIESIKTTTLIDQRVLGMMDLLSSQLTNICCGAKKIQALLKEIEERKESILERLRFSSFVEQHPGLEHKAGVEPGGTFVMVYALSFDPIAKIQQGTVIADFALPYLCCSECAPINFIVQKTPVSLTISNGFYCLSEEDTPLSFNVTPADGAIATEDPIPGVTVDGTNLLIDSELFPQEMLGIPIKFTVNGQYTDCVLIVRRKPNVEMVISNDAANPLTYIFEATGELSGATITWDFGDGTPTGNTIVATHTYDIPLANGAKSVDVTLTVVPGDQTCPAVLTQPILFDEITVSISPTAVCANGEPIPFDIQPVGANPVITGVGVTEDMKAFDPALTGGLSGPFDLTYNGEVFASMTLLSGASSDFTSVVVEPDINIFPLIVDESATYQWQVYDLNNNLIFESTETAINLEIAKLGKLTALKVSLTASNACGSTETSKMIDIPQTPTLTITPDVFCSEDKGPYTIVASGFSGEVLIEGDGVVNGVFVPSTGKIGSNNITANGVVMLTVQVIQAPTANFFVSMGQDAFQLAADFSNVDDFKWTFSDLSGNTILPSDTVNKNPQILYTAVENVSTLVVQLFQVSALCGEVSTSQEVQVPRDVITDYVFSITPKFFCENDNGPYDFTITPLLDGKPEIKGPGVVDNQFIPSLAGASTHTITASTEDGKFIGTLDITVFPYPTGSVKAGIIDGALLHAEVGEIVGVKSSYWQLEGAKREAIIIPDQLSIDIPTGSLLRHTDGERTYYIVTLFLQGEMCNEVIQIEVDDKAAGGNVVVVTDPREPIGTIDLSSGTVVGDFTNFNLISVNDIGSVKLDI